MIIINLIKTKLMKCLSFIWLFLFTVFWGFAQTDTVQMKTVPQDLQNVLDKIQQQAKQTKIDADIEIDGLLVNNTKTKNGKDFYELFYRDWNAPPEARNYTIFVFEKPYRLTTTIIEIKINETIVFQSYMQPRLDFIELIAQQAVLQTQRYLENYEQIVKQLEGKDFSGSGIY